jgi:NADPH:quinone reductase-like Zn-dependent oxidoreductase
MKAIVCARYGPPEVLQLIDVATPTPKDNEVLIKVFATTANSADLRLRSADFPPLVQIPMHLMMGFRGPRKRILGVELAGEIEAIGGAVTRFKPGDQVYASSGYALSGYAEYICLAEKAAIAIKPVNMTYEEAAAVPHGALCALHFLRKGNVQHGQKVMVFGASGSIGTFAKHFGAEVTGVCSTAKVEAVKSLGADHVIDYTQEDFTQNGQTYDAIFDTIGKSPFAGCVESLNENGYYLRAVHLELSAILRGAWTSMTTGKKVIGGVSDSTYTTESLDFLRDLIEAGELKAVIDRTYPLEQMAEAHRYAETGRKTGNIAITVTQTD